MKNEFLSLDNADNEWHDSEWGSVKLRRREFLQDDKGYLYKWSLDNSLANLFPVERYENTEDLEKNIYEERFAQLSHENRYRLYQEPEPEPLKLADLADKWIGRKGSMLFLKIERCDLRQSAEFKWYIRDEWLSDKQLMEEYDILTAEQVDNYKVKE
jgi:hypothetical protein